MHCKLPSSFHIPHDLHLILYYAIRIENFKNVNVVVYVSKFSFLFNILELLPSQSSTSCFASKIQTQKLPQSNHVFCTFGWALAIELSNSHNECSLSHLIHNKGLLVLSANTKNSPLCRATFLKSLTSYAKHKFKSWKCKMEIHLNHATKRSNST
jgi:hypothetical protein